MIKLIELKSSNLAAAGHDPATNTLRVHFHGGAVFDYQDVPAEKAEGLMKAESPGRFFHANIRGQYADEPVIKDDKAAA